MINVLIDKLTNSIVNRITGDVFNTEVLAITSKDLKNITKKNKWNFNWKSQSKDGQVYKLVISGNLDIIQGLVCIKDGGDHIYLALIENAPFNIGVDKVYEGVAGNLFAFACQKSFEKGYGGYVSFHAKTELIAHYEKLLNAQRVGKSLLMIIDTASAQILVNKYFKT
jgi:hypothetical protein